MAHPFGDNDPKAAMLTRSRLFAEWAEQRHPAFAAQCSELQSWNAVRSPAKALVNGGAGWTKFAAKPCNSALCVGYPVTLRMMTACQRREGSRPCTATIIFWS
jgi:hypothetical protein